MAEFKFYLNGTQVEEPMNWMDSKFEYRRDPDLPGLITTFVADVEFYGNAYEIIKTEFESGFGCGEILVKIEEQCNGGINRDGIIFLSEIDLDLYRCVAKCNIEDNTIYGKLSRLKDVKIEVNCEKTVNGQVLTPIQTYPMPFRDTNYSLGGRYSTSINTAQSMYRMFRAGEVLQHFLNYITDNDATIVSSFFSDEVYNEQVCGMIVDWTGSLPIPPGDTQAKAIVSWTDVYGNNQTQDIALTSLLDYDVINSIAYLIQWQSTPTTDEVDLYQGIQPRAVDYIVIGNADVTYSGQDMIRFRFFQQTSVSLTIRSYPSDTLVYTAVDYYQIPGRKLETTASKNMNGTYGGFNLFLNSGGAFKPSNTTNQANRTRTNTMYASFQDIFSSLSSLYNLSMYPYFDGNTQYVRIEQEPYFFPTTSPTITINNARLVSKRKDSEFVISKFNYSQMNANVWAYLQSQVGYISDDCGDRDASINTSLSFPQDGFFTNTDLIDADAIYMVDYGGYVSLNAAQPQLLWGAFVVPGGSVPANEWPGSVSYVNDFSTTTGPPFFGKFLMYVGSAVHPLVAKNYVIRTSNGLKVKGITVDNTSSLHIKYLYSIEVPLTRDELNLILADPPAPIVFNGITGWILNMSHDIKTGMTNFELLTE